MESNMFDLGPLADVTAEADDDGKWTLTFIRMLRHPPAKVWGALTEPEQLRKWSPFTADRDLGRTGNVTLTMIDGEHAEAMAGTVVRAEAPSLLEYTRGDDHFRWELEAVDSGTRLTLHHTVPGPEWLSKVTAGWHICLVVAERMLDGDDIGPIVGENARNYGWDELNEKYAERLGIKGS
jgi:uncharacterized protein YndB with AHSA1/START domain